MRGHSVLFPGLPTWLGRFPVLFVVLVGRRGENYAALSLPGIAARISASHRARCLPHTSGRCAGYLGHRDLLQRGQRQEHAGPAPRSRSVLQGRVRALPQDARSDVGGSEGCQIGDDRPEAEADGAYFGGYVRPANLKEERVDRRLKPKR